MEAFKDVTLSQAAISVIFIVTGIILARLSSRAIARFGKDRFTQHHSLLFQRLSYYLIIVVFIFTALQQIGLNLGVLVGAAGILTVALGFASQTSASNVISGLFLLGEKPFTVGDCIKLGETSGEVISIDLLSVKIRTYDNLFVRIPNETIIKSDVTTLTKFPIRRFDLMIGVAYKEDLERVQTVLKKVAEDYHLCLDDPNPLILFLGFGESSIDIQFSTWTKRENWIDFKNEMVIRVKKAFDEQDIEIPFPHRTIYTGSVTSAFPIVSVKPSMDNDCDTL